MNIINSSVELLRQPETGLDGIYEQIERCGKTCYKSTPKGGKSAKEFVDRLETNHHTAMLEHGTVYLYDKDWNGSPLEKYKRNKNAMLYLYSAVILMFLIILFVIYSNSVKLYIPDAFLK